LARRHFVAKTPTYDRWISLDFLGFSRPNQALSMGYAGFSLENFSSPFTLGVRSAGRDLESWEAKAQDCSWGKLSSISDFLQDIVV
jgi:hypothetical protein